VRWSFPCLRSFTRTYVRCLRYSVYVESSLDHSLTLIESGARAAATSLQSNGVVTAANVMAIRALVDFVDILCTRSVASFASSPVIREGGFRDISDWLAHNTHARPSEGAQRVAHLEILTKLAGWSEAIDEGTIGVSHVGVVTRVATKARLPLLERDSLMLLDLAQKMSFVQFRQAVALWVSHCDDALGDPTSEKEHDDARRLQLSPTPGGMWILNGLLDPLGGEALSKALEAAMPKPCEGDNRTPAQRRHDALVDIAHESLANEDRMVVGGERPHVTITVDARSGIAHTSQLIRLSSFTRDMLLCDCVITSVWLSADGTPFDVGTPTSEVPIRNRRAVLVRDQCCRFPGCSRLARWTDIHHIRERKNRGTHELENLCALCKFHHRYVHRHKLKIRWDRDHASLIFEWPNGRTANSPPPPHFLFAR
jgi:Domain of unknown function (DUF222)